MNRAEAEHVLTPIILGFRVAKDRANELLRQSQELGLCRERLHDVVRHEAELEQALAFLDARLKGWSVDGLNQVVDTGRSFFTWPNVMPGSDYQARIIADWESKKESAPRLEPLGESA